MVQSSTVGLVSSDVFDLPCAERTKASLRALVASPPRGHLIVVTGPPGDLPLAAATALAFNLVSPAARATDVRVVAPVKDRWSVEEVSDAIIAPAQLRPVERTVIVVDAAEAMDTPAAEHLLKVVEEPPSNALFIFVTSNVEELLATLRSRAAAVVIVEGLSVAARVERLVDAGADKAVAVEVIGLCGHLSALAQRAATDPDLLAALRVVFNAPLRSKHPTADAVALADALDTLASSELITLADSGDGEPEHTTKRAASTRNATKKSAKKKADPAQKARVRVLVRHMLDARRQAVAQLLRGDMTAEAFAKVLRHAAAIDQANLELSGYANPKHVLAALLSRTSV